jgi:hypothetical protein
MPLKVQTIVLELKGRYQCEGSQGDAMEMCATTHKKGMMHIHHTCAKCISHMDHIHTMHGTTHMPHVEQACAMFIV